MTQNVNGKNTCRSMLHLVLTVDKVANVTYAFHMPRNGLELCAKVGKTIRSNMFSYFTSLMLMLLLKCHMTGQYILHSFNRFGKKHLLGPENVGNRSGILSV